MLTPLACVSEIAVAREPIDQIRANSAILARLAGAVINVDITKLSCPTGGADTVTGEEFVHTGSVLAWIIPTQINFFVAAFSGEARRTVTLEVID